MGRWFAIYWFFAAHCRSSWALLAFSCHYCRLRLSFYWPPPAGQRLRRAFTIGCIITAISARSYKTGKIMAPCRARQSYSPSAWWPFLACLCFGNFQNAGGLVLYHQSSVAAWLCGCGYGRKHKLKQVGIFAYLFFLFSYPIYPLKQSVRTKTHYSPLIFQTASIYSIKCKF